MPTGRAEPVVAVVNGVLYAIGGGAFEIGPDVVYSTVEGYVPGSNNWWEKNPLPVPCWGAAGGVISGKIYVVGCGASTYAYDPAANAWTSRAAMPSPRQSLVAVVVGGTLFAIGGALGAGSSGPYDGLEAYDPQTDSWTNKTPPPTARVAACGTAIGGMVYVVGGEKQIGPSVYETLDTVQEYDPAQDTWTAKSPMPAAVAGAACGAIAGKMYVVGGRLTDYTYTEQSLLQIYDPQSDTWELGPVMPTARFFSGAGVVEDTLYVVGGYPALSVNEAFSPFEKVNIDIRPGDPNNVINLKSGGVVQVAILGSATFDPKTVEPSTVTFAGAPAATRGKGAPMTALADVNHDGYPDLILFFRTQDLQLTTADTEAVLYGKTYSGTPIRGSGPVKLLAPRRH